MWLILSLTNALATGLQNAYYKKASLQISPYLMVWSILVVSSIAFSPLLLFGVPHLGPNFWPAVIIRLVIDSIAFTLYVKGVQASPLSLTVPMLSLTPLFSVISVHFINHQLPSPLGIAGLIVICAGIYFLNFDHNTKHILSPFKAVIRQRGVRYVAIAAIIWSVVISLQKLGIDNSSVNFYTPFFQLTWAILFAPVAYLADRQGFTKLLHLKQLKQVAPAGILDGIQVYAQNAAYLFALPVYVNAVGNTGILFSSFFGWYFFKEKLQKHVIPTLLIVIGITLISLAQK